MKNIKGCSNLFIAIFVKCFYGWSHHFNYITKLGKNNIELSSYHGLKKIKLCSRWISGLCIERKIEIKKFRALYIDNM